MPTSKKKPKSFTFMLSKQEYERLWVLAKLDGRSMSNYLRHIINTRSSAKAKQESQGGKP